MSIYCTYLTVYSGNKLPPFYIGHTSIKKIQNGYHGTVSSQKYKSIWKQELKEHPELFQSCIITTHSCKKSANDRERSLQKSLGVIKNPLYINQSIFPNINRMGKKHSLETRQKIGEKSRGRIPWNKGKPHPKMIGNNFRLGKSHSLETKEKMSTTHKGKIMSPETRYNMSLGQYKRWQNVIV